MGRKAKSTHPAQEAFDFLVDNPVATSKPGGGVDSGAPIGGPFFADRSTIESFDIRSNADASGAPASDRSASKSDAGNVSAEPISGGEIDERSESATKRADAPDSGVQGTITESDPLSIHANSDADSLPEIDTQAAGSGASGRRVLDDDTGHVAPETGEEAKCSGESSGLRSIALTKVAVYSKKSRAKFLERGMSEVRARVLMSCGDCCPSPCQEFSGSGLLTSHIVTASSKAKAALGGRPFTCSWQISIACQAPGSSHFGTTRTSCVFGILRTPTTRSTVFGAAETWITGALPILAAAGGRAMSGNLPRTLT